MNEEHHSVSSSGLKRYTHACVTVQQMLNSELGYLKTYHHFQPIAIKSLDGVSEQ